MTPWTIDHQATLSMRFSRQEYWSGLLCPPLGDLPHSGIKPGSPVLQADSLLSESPGKDAVGTDRHCLMPLERGTSKSHIVESESMLVGARGWGGCRRWGGEWRLSVQWGQSFSLGK